MRPLPADLVITERSRKFYDSTYKWDSDGFTDEHGGKYTQSSSGAVADPTIVYREYDCLDPLARAPTPLPPMFSDDEGDDQLDPTTMESAQLLGSSNTVMLVGSSVLEPDTPCPRPNSTAAVPRTPGSICRSAIDFLTRPEQSGGTTTGEVNLSSQDITNTVSRLGDTTAKSEQVNTIEALHRSYELCEGPISTKRESSRSKMPDTPPDSPVKTLSVMQNTSPASTISTLSPVPSNLSDHGKDEGIKIESARTAPNTPSLPNTPSKGSPQPKKKGTTTRGVAQKVTKGSKRAYASKSNPPKRKENSVEDFTLLELHSRSFLRKGGFRKSARQAKLERK